MTGRVPTIHSHIEPSPPDGHPSNPVAGLSAQDPNSEVNGRPRPSAGLERIVRSPLLSVTPAVDVFSVLFFPLKTMNHVKGELPILVHKAATWVTPGYFRSIVSHIGLQEEQAQAQSMQCARVRRLHGALSHSTCHLHILPEM